MISVVGRLCRQWGYQFSAEDIHYFADWELSSHDGPGVQAMLRDLLARNEHPLISLVHGVGDAHTVVAYNVTPNPAEGPDAYFIDVYDPNREFQAAERGNGWSHQQQEDASRIHVRGNEWSFTMADNRVWQGGFGTLIVLPYSRVPQNPTLPTTLEGLGKLVFGSLDAAPQLVLGASGTLTVNGFLLGTDAPNAVTIGVTDSGEIEVTLDGQRTRYPGGQPAGRHQRAAVGRDHGVRQPRRQPVQGGAGLDPRDRDEDPGEMLLPL